MLRDSVRDSVRDTSEKIKELIQKETSDPTLAIMLTDLKKKTDELQEEQKKKEEVIGDALAIIDSAQEAAVERIDQQAAPVETVNTAENLSDPPDPLVETERADSPDASVETKLADPKEGQEMGGGRYKSRRKEKKTNKKKRRKNKKTYKK